MENKKVARGIFFGAISALLVSGCMVFQPTKVLTETTLVDWKSNNIPATEIQYRLKGTFELFRELDSKAVRVEGGTIKKSNDIEVESLLFVDGIKGVSMGTDYQQYIHVSFSMDDETGLKFVSQGGEMVLEQLENGKVVYKGAQWKVKNPNGGELIAPRVMYVASSKSKVKNKTTVVRGRSL